MAIVHDDTHGHSDKVIVSDREPRSGVGVGAVIAIIAIILLLFLLLGNPFGGSRSAPTDQGTQGATGGESNVNVEQPSQQQPAPTNSTDTQTPTQQ